MRKLQIDKVLNGRKRHQSVTPTTQELENSIKMSEEQ